VSQKSVLVLGGGIAGASAALDLAREGVRVLVVEQDDFLGGHAARLACKATDDCLKCNGCLVEPRLADLVAHPGIELYLRTRVTAVTREGSGYLVTLERRPAYIDPERCTDCGLCLAKCPVVEQGAIRRTNLVGQRPRLAIDPAVCVYFRDRQSTLCRDVCPEEAIRFDLEPTTETVRMDAVVLATGFQAYDPATKPRFGYGQVPNVITGLDLETQLKRDGAPRRPSDGRTPRRVAFIQCVGSRERERHNYCSRVCCGYALRLGRALRHRFGCEVTVFYMDIQSFGHAFDEFLAAAEGELDLIRQIPGEAWPGEDGEVLVQYVADPAQGQIFRPFDLLVLSVGVAPNPANAALADWLGLGLDEHGFVAEPSPEAGPVFLAGTVTRPLDVSEVVAHAGRAARETIRYLEEK
jgi:heterodisulfide reductase subunit A